MSLLVRFDVDEEPEGKRLFKLLTLGVANFGMISAIIAGVVGLGYLDRSRTLVNNVRYIVDRALVLRRGVVPSTLRAGVVEEPCSLSCEWQDGKCGKGKLFHCYHIEVSVLLGGNCLEELLVVEYPLRGGRSRSFYISLGFPAYSQLAV